MLLLKDKPRRLHLFLEYSKVANPDVKAEEVMEAFWKCRAECHIALSSRMSKGFGTTTAWSLASL